MPNRFYEEGEGLIFTSEPVTDAERKRAKKLLDEITVEEKTTEE